MCSKDLEVVALFPDQISPERDSMCFTVNKVFVDGPAMIITRGVFRKVFLRCCLFNRDTSVVENHYCRCVLVFWAGC